MRKIIADRRLFLRRVLSGSIAIGAAIPFFLSTEAQAASLETQQAANYVDHPGPGGNKCGSCQFFVANPSNEARALREPAWQWQATSAQTAIAPIFLQRAESKML